MSVGGNMRVCGFKAGELGTEGIIFDASGI